MYYITRPLLINYSSNTGTTFPDEMNMVQSDQMHDYIWVPKSNNQGFGIHPHYLQCYLSLINYTIDDYNIRYCVLSQKKWMEVDILQST